MAPGVVWLHEGINLVNPTSQTRPARARLTDDLTTRPRHEEASQSSRHGTRPSVDQYIRVLTGLTPRPRPARTRLTDNLTTGSWNESSHTASIPGTSCQVPGHFAPTKLPWKSSQAWSLPGPGRAVRHYITWHRVWAEQRGRHWQTQPPYPVKFT